MFALMEFIMPVFVVLFFVVFFGIIIKGVGQWHKNNQSPRLTVEAKVVSKQFSHHHHHNAQHHTTTTSYSVTFQVESGDRMELSMSSSEYAMLAEGDKGKLTFQGTRYLGFERR